MTTLDRYTVHELVVHIYRRKERQVSQLYDPPPTDNPVPWVTIFGKAFKADELLLSDLEYLSNVDLLAVAEWALQAQRSS